MTDYMNPAVDVSYGSDDLMTLARIYADDTNEHRVIRTLLADMRIQILTRDTQYDRACIAEGMLTAAVAAERERIAVAIESSPTDESALDSGISYADFYRYGLTIAARIARAGEEK